MPSGVYLHKSGYKRGKHSEEHKRRISEGLLKNPPMLGKHHTEETRIKMRISHLGKPIPEVTKNKLRILFRGSGNPHWVNGNYKRQDERNDSLYQYWSRQVKLRDKWTCRMKDSNCSGKVIAHHILSFTSFPELRYAIDNGITLCKFHHPRKRTEEKRFIPIFQEMIKAGDLN